MPSKLVNFSIGSSAGCAVALFVYYCRHWLYRHTKFMQWLYEHQRWWVLYIPFFIMIFGLWAIMPDILLALGLVSAEWTHSSAADIFFFHGYIEMLEHALPRAENRLLSIFGEASCAVIYGGCIAAYILFIRRLQKEIRGFRK